MDTSRLSLGLPLWKPRRHKSPPTLGMGNLDMVCPGMTAFYSKAFCSLVFLSSTTTTTFFTVQNRIKPKVFAHPREALYH